MQTMKRKTWATVALVAIIALIAVTACQAPTTAPTGPVHVVLDNAGDLGAGGELPASAAGDTNLTNLVTSGDVTVGGGLTVTGGVTGTNVLVTGNQTIAGIKTFSTPAVIPVITGPTAAATGVPGVYVNNLGAANVSFEVRDAATPVFQVLNGGAVAANAVYSYVPVSAKTGNYTVTTADTGLTIKSSGAITMTLPGAVAGLQYCIVNFDGSDLTLDVTDTADVFLNEVNSPGDRVTNTTAFDSICVRAIDATNWVTISSLGTWADGN